MKFLALSLLTLSMVAEALPEKKIKNPCRPIRGFISVEFTTENCASPVGICTKGKIWGDPIFQGTTSYTVEKVSGTPIDPTMNQSLAYAGTLKIKTRHGEITIPDLGLMDKNSTLVSSQSREVSGNGKLANLYGAFFTVGQATATGFNSEISGRACFKVKPSLALN